jgi:hypothetical protein
MSLGSIAHLQYYFARTGLLDGKGGQTARSKKKGEKEIPKLMLSQQAQFSDDMVDSPIEEIEDGFDLSGEHEPMMLPPTVSTYSVPTHYIPPPPDLMDLRKGLQDSLDKVRQAIEKAKEEPSDALRPTIPDKFLEPDGDPSDNPPIPAKPQWRDIQGMHILDVVTLAIRAARIYYTSHDEPERLASIKSERRIREELMGVLDVLKRWATRGFAGGLKDEEQAAILEWMSGVKSMLDEERKLEEIEADQRANWGWTGGDWAGKEREREEAFLQCLENTGHPLPTWTPAETGPLPTEFLERLRDGRDLIRLHNCAIKKSKRQFGEIKSFHEDVTKPYRRADNLRYWIKAAEIRWEIKLEMDVMGVVYGNNDDAWKKFDAALLVWCTGVREELVRDWINRPTKRRATIPSDLEVLATEVV